jgi:DNA (cytosine-5)-methyltransferase 1
MKDKLAVIDLFSGCGGLSEGFLQTGKYDGIAHVEWEAPMVNTLRNRLVTQWGHTEEEARRRVVQFDIQQTEELLEGKWRDETIRSYASNNHSEIIKNGLKGLIRNTNIDVIVGGPPCQAYSIHGRAKDPNSMSTDYRNFLFEGFVKIVDSLKPKVFVFENVPGILTAKPGGVPITTRIYEAFREIGYKVLHPDDLNLALFNSSNFHVPQNRKRILLIGVKENNSLNLDEIYQEIRRREDPENKTTVKDAIGFLPVILPLKKAIKDGRKNISHYSETNHVAQHIPRYHNSRDVEIFKEWVTNKMNYISHSEKVRYYQNKTKKNTLYSKYRNLEWDKQAYTIVAHLQKDGLMFIHPDSNQARSITIREAALLMTFPLDYEFIGSNAYCYKMIGNAVPVNLAKAIGESLYQVLSNKDEK